MEKAFEFLKRNKGVAFATVEDGKPKIRVFEIMRQQENTLYFVTAPGKKVYRQLQANPNVEILAMKGNIFVRIGFSTLATLHFITTILPKNNHKILVRETLSFFFIIHLCCLLPTM